MPRPSFVFGTLYDASDFYIGQPVTIHPAFHAMAGGVSGDVEGIRAGGQVCVWVHGADRLVWVLPAWIQPDER